MFRLAERGEQNHRNVARLRTAFDLPREFEAGHDRHFDIAEDHIKSLLTEDEPRFRAVNCYRDIKTRRFEDILFQRARRD